MKEKDKNYVLTRGELYTGCKALTIVNFILLVAVNFTFLAVIAAPSVVTKILFDAIYEDFKAGFAVYWFFVLMFILSMILLKLKNRYFVLWPMIYLCIDIIFTIYSILITVTEGGLKNILSLNIFFLLGIEAWEVYLYFNCMRRCKDIGSLGGKTSCGSENTAEQMSDKQEKNLQEE